MSDKYETTTSVSSILKILSNNRMEQNMDMPARAKKRRLDHLSWDEKVQRKKLKNRVAAQTSRDRKKAKMEQMETAIKELFANNESLADECDLLRQANERLQSENESLHKQLKDSCSHCFQNRSVEYVAERGSTETLLRPQGTATNSAAILNPQTLALWKIMIAFLLYQTCSMSSTPTSTLTAWAQSRRASSKISQETWKKLLKRQILRNQSLVDKAVLKKWWGRHQKNWNPVDVRQKTC